MSNKHQAPAEIVSVASTLAGITEAVCVQPFDMVKTRNQLNRSISPSLYKSFLEVYCEGGLLRFYRGLLPELIGFIPKTNAQYLSYEYSRRHLSKTYNNGHCNAIICAMSGYIAGYATAFTVTPSQIIKIRLQSKEYLGLYKNTAHCYYKVLTEEGLGSLMIGLGPTIYRNSIWNTIYFGLMYYIKHEILPETEDAHSIYALSQTMISGFIGGVIATCFNAPFDVVKSRFQQQRIGDGGDGKRYKYTLVELYRIYKYDGGIKGCYRGLQPKIIRMGIGGAVSMATFEMICNSYTKYKDQCNDFIDNDLFQF